MSSKEHQDKLNAMDTLDRYLCEDGFPISLFGGILKLVDLKIKNAEDWKRYVYNRTDVIVSYSPDSNQSLVDTVDEAPHEESIPLTNESDSTQQPDDDNVNVQSEDEEAEEEENYDQL
jgi:hypothetical protein